MPGNRRRPSALERAIAGPGRDGQRSSPRSGAKYWLVHQRTLFCRCSILLVTYTTGFAKSSRGLPSCRSIPCCCYGQGIRYAAVSQPWNVRVAPPYLGYAAGALKSRQQSAAPYAQMSPGCSSSASWLWAWGGRTVRHGDAVSGSWTRTLQRQHRAFSVLASVAVSRAVLAQFPSGHCWWCSWRVACRTVVRGCLVYPDWLHASL